MIDSQVFKEPKMVTDEMGTSPPLPCEGLWGGHGGGSTGQGRVGPCGRALAPALGGGARHQVPAHAHVLRGGRPCFQRGPEAAC